MDNEIVSLRTEVSKTFDLGDGQRKLVKHQGPIHYKGPGSSEFVEIDLTPVDQGDHWLVDSGPYLLKIFKHNCEIEYTSAQGGTYKVKLTKLGHIPVRDLDTVPVIIDGNIHFNNISHGVDIYLDIRPNKIEWFKVLHHENTITDFEWEVEEEDNGQATVNNVTKGWDNAKANLRCSNTIGPKISSNGFSKYSVKETFHKQTSKIVDKTSRKKEWVDEVEYPILIDVPDITENITTGNDDVMEFVSSGSSGSLHYSWISLPVGTSSSYTLNGGLRFQTVGLPAAANIDLAELQLYVTSKTGTPAVKLYGDDVDDAAEWTSYSNKPSDITKTTASTSLTSIPSSGNYTVDVTDVIQEIVDRPGWASGNDIRMGLLNTLMVNNYNYFMIAAYEHLGYPSATLEITYSTGLIEVDTPTVSIDTSDAYVGDPQNVEVDTTSVDSSLLDASINISEDVEIDLLTVVISTKSVEIDTSTLRTSFIGNTQNDSPSATTLTVSKHGSLTEGDLMLASAIYSNNSDVATWVAPSGWIRVDLLQSTTGRDMDTAIFWRVATASEPASWDFVSGATASSNMSVMIDVFRNTDPNNTFDVTYIKAQHTEIGNDNSLPTNKPIDVNRDRSLVYLVHIATHDDITVAGAPSGYIIGGDIVGIDKDHRQQVSAYKNNVGPGTETPGVWTHTASPTNIAEYHVWTLSISGYAVTIPVDLGTVDVDISKEVTVGDPQVLEIGTASVGVSFIPTKESEFIEIDLAAISINPLDITTSLRYKVRKVSPQKAHTEPGTLGADYTWVNPGNISVSDEADAKSSGTSWGVRDTTVEWLVGHDFRIVLDEGEYVYALKIGIEGESPFGSIKMEYVDPTLMLENVGLDPEDPRAFTIDACTLVPVPEGIVELGSSDNLIPFSSNLTVLSKTEVGSSSFGVAFNIVKPDNGNSGSGTNREVKVDNVYVEMYTLLDQQLILADQSLVIIPTYDVEVGSLPMHTLLVSIDTQDLIVNARDNIDIDLTTIAISTQDVKIIDSIDIDTATVTISTQTVNINAEDLISVDTATVSIDLNRINDAEAISIDPTLVLVNTKDPLVLVNLHITPDTPVVNISTLAINLNAREIIFIGSPVAIDISTLDISLKEDTLVQVTSVLTISVEIQPHILKADEAIPITSTQAVDIETLVPNINQSLIPDLISVLTNTQDVIINERDTTGIDLASVLSNNLSVEIFAGSLITVDDLASVAVSTNPAIVNAREILGVDTQAVTVSTGTADINEEEQINITSGGVDVTVQTPIINAREDINIDPTSVSINTQTAEGNARENINIDSASVNISTQSAVVNEEERVNITSGVVNITTQTTEINEEGRITLDVLVSVDVATQSADINEEEQVNITSGAVGVTTQDPVLNASEHVNIDSVLVDILTKDIIIKAEDLIDMLPQAVVIETSEVIVNERVVAEIEVTSVIASTKDVKINDTTHIDVGSVSITTNGVIVNNRVLIPVVTGAVAVTNFSVNIKADDNVDLDSTIIEVTPGPVGINASEIIQLDTEASVGINLNNIFVEIDGDILFTISQEVLKEVEDNVLQFVTITDEIDVYSPFHVATYQMVDPEILEINI